MEPDSSSQAGTDRCTVAGGADIDGLKRQRGSPARERPLPAAEDEGVQPQPYSSTRSWAIRVWASCALPMTRRSSVISALSPAIVSGTTPDSTVVGPHAGSSRVRDTTYFAVV